MYMLQYCAVSWLGDQAAIVWNVMGTKPGTITMTCQMACKMLSFVNAV